MYFYSQALPQRFEINSFFFFAPMILLFAPMILLIAEWLSSYSPSSTLPLLLICREVMEVAKGTLPYLHLSTDCRCPPSHPADSPTTEGVCIQNTGTGMPNRGSVLRVNSQSHPAGYLNDLTTTDSWISNIGQAGLNITAHLTNSLYEVCTHRNPTNLHSTRPFSFNTHFCLIN